MADQLGGRVRRGARLADAGLRSLAGLVGSAARRDPAAAHDEIAARLAEVLGEMKGAAMKLGQILSFVDLDLPPDVRTVYHDALARLRDAAPAFDHEAIRDVIRREYGAPPEAVFAS